MKRIIYVDNAATTRVSNEVFNAMEPFFIENFGNPSSIYSIGRECRRAIENSRKIIAQCINAEPSEIFFTSGGTESDNWAIKSGSKLKSGSSVITSQIEHHAVLNSVKYLETLGNFETIYLKPDMFGTIQPEALKKKIDRNTSLVSIMMANNEIGTIQPIEEFANICKHHGVLFHTDAVQAAGHLEIDTKKLGIDMCSISGHKFHGPKGIGVLFVKKGLKLSQFLHGGSQEQNKRAGTENVALIVGMAKALELATVHMKSNSNRLIKMQKKLIKNILKIEKTILTGHPIKRIPGTASFCFEGVEGESILLNLDAHGIYASSGSACTSGSLDPSHVLLAIGLTHEIAHGSLRLTLGNNNSEEDIDEIINILPKVIAKLRLMSPVWEKISTKII
ncbi:MAG: aminotransferase class V-fold PLP-dependent enzyme [Firmicutes bacterium]|nr:aminotransferase class V-fold PLP-dependent enzyme [Bacillota bacterium]